MGMNSGEEWNQTSKMYLFCKLEKEEFNLIFDKIDADKSGMISKK